MNSQLILVVEEDARLACSSPTSSQRMVTKCWSPRTAPGRWRCSHPSAGTGLADLNGQTLSLLDAVRAGEGLAGEIDPGTPMIVLTAQAGEFARVRVFDRGGDDVLSKPFSYPELRGRIRALLRRACEPRHTAVTRVGVLSVDHRAHEVRVGDRLVALSGKEFELLCALIADPTRVITKRELLRDVWGVRGETRTRTLDSHACRLRGKLAAADPGRRLVINVWGVGYRLCDSEAQQ